MILSLIAFTVTARALYILWSNYDTMCPRRELHDAHRILQSPPRQPLRWLLGWWRSLQAWTTLFTTPGETGRNTRAKYRAWWIMWGSVTCLFLTGVELFAHDWSSVVLFHLALWGIVHEHFNALLKG